MSTERITVTERATATGRTLDQLFATQEALSKERELSKELLAALTEARDKVASASAADAGKWTTDLLKIVDHVKAQCATIDAAIAKATQQ